MSANRKSPTPTSVNSSPSLATTSGRGERQNSSLLAVNRTNSQSSLATTKSSGSRQPEDPNSPIWLAKNSARAIAKRQGSVEFSPSLYPGPRSVEADSKLGVPGPYSQAFGSSNHHNSPRNSDYADSPASTFTRQTSSYDGGSQSTPIKASDVSQSSPAVRKPSLCTTERSFVPRLTVSLTTMTLPSVLSQSTAAASYVPSFEGP